MNRRTLESLISAGACDKLEGNRAQKFAAVELALDFGQKISAKNASHDLFAAPGGEIARVAPDLPDLPDWPNSQKLTEEKNYLERKLPFLVEEATERIKEELRKEGWKSK